MSELSKLRWLCRRGMKELDILLEAYLESSYASADENEREIFASLLNLQDPELYQLILNQKQHEDKDIEHVAHKIRNAVNC